MAEQLPLPLDIVDLGKKVGSLPQPSNPITTLTDQEQSVTQDATKSPVYTIPSEVNGVPTVPTSAVLVYNFPPEQPNEFNVLVAHRIISQGIITLLEDSALENESPIECAIRTMRDQASLVPDSSDAIVQEFPGPLIVETSYGLLAFSLFTCDLAKTNGAIQLPNTQRDKILTLRLVPSPVFYDYAKIGLLEMVNLAGAWQQRFRTVLKENRLKRKLKKK